MGNPRGRIMDTPLRVNHTMSPTPSLRLLASTNNARGDLFTRLMKDLFFALGYDDLRLDVAKTGREVDLSGQHRHEPRRVIAECKAASKPIGGADLNKFFGVLARERRVSTPVAGYFISLSGFTEPGILQEDETGADRVILLDAQKVIWELENSRVLVSQNEAAEQAGRCAEYAGLKDAKLDRAELLGHNQGYIWAVFYSQGKARTHFALVHADGTALGEAAAREVIQADRLARGSLHKLQLLTAAPPPPDRAALARAAETQYRQWVGEECGFIQLDGLPADTDLSATRLKLEKLFVPLRVSSLDDQHFLVPWPIAHILRETPHLALLADPGGGKSTLLKRLAVAYTFPERRAEVVDGLPNRDWLPLFLRCRTLRDRAQCPILELITGIAREASLSGGEMDAFGEVVHTALRTGRAILLVDGLDEISDEGARKTFAQNLRTFLAMFPQTTLVVTSREAGFRLVAGVVASVCRRARLAPLDEEDVQHLCEHWHVEVVGDSEKVRLEARELAAAIWNNDRIRSLAQNPLLLTTLLVVKRWIGELPRSRAALYREAVRVLLRTWNVEGFAPLDEEETLAQLSYVACAMMLQGVQQIGHRKLLRLLQEARRELEAELQLTRVPATELIDRIEYRSSLLMQTGYILEQSELQPVYEFRHLTFQEYLAARGYVVEQYPGRNHGKSLVDLMEPHFEDERWREVIPLATVLAGRKAEDVVKRLTHICEHTTRGPSYSYRESTVAIVLSRCLLDEVQVTTAALRGALRQAGRVIKSDRFKALLQGRFGELFQEECEASFMGGGTNWEDWAQAMLSIHQRGDLLEPPVLPELDEINALQEAIQNTNRLARVRATAAVVDMAFRWKRFSENPAGILKSIESLRSSIAAMLQLDDPPLALMATLAFVWMGANRSPKTPPDPAWVLSLYRIWREADSAELARLAGWALSTQPLLPRDSFSKEAWGDCEEWLQTALAQEGPSYHGYGGAAVVVNWYRQAPLNDKQLVEKIQLARKYETPGVLSTMREVLNNVGESGRRVLEDWEEEKARN